MLFLFLAVGVVCAVNFLDYTVMDAGELIVVFVSLSVMAFVLLC